MSPRPKRVKPLLALCLWPSAERSFLLFVFGLLGPLQGGRGAKKPRPPRQPGGLGSSSSSLYPGGSRSDHPPHTSTIHAPILTRSLPPSHNNPPGSLLGCRPPSRRGCPRVAGTRPRGKGHGPRVLPSPVPSPFQGSFPTVERRRVHPKPSDPSGHSLTPRGTYTLAFRGRASAHPLVAPRPPCGGRRTGKPVRAFLGQVPLAGFVHRWGYGAPPQAIPLRTGPVSPSCTPPFSPPPPLRYAAQLLPNG